MAAAPDPCLFLYRCKQTAFVTEALLLQERPAKTWLCRVFFDGVWMLQQRHSAVQALTLSAACPHSYLIESACD